MSSLMIEETLTSLKYYFIGPKHVSIAKFRLTSLSVISALAHMSEER